MQLETLSLPSLLRIFAAIKEGSDRHTAERMPSLGEGEPTTLGHSVRLKAEEEDGSAA